MAFSRTRTERPESLLFRPPQSPRDDPSFASYATPLSPLRSLASRVTPTLQPSSDVRGSLQRRFTTNALPTLAPIGEQRKQALQAMDQWDNSQLGFGRISATEKKAREYEALLAQQRRIQAQMEMIDPETRREVDDIQRLERDINHFTSGVLSEPATPPDHRKIISHSNIPYSNRFSASFMTSPNTTTRPLRSATQVASPGVDYARPFTSGAASQIPSRSVPGSQRNSDHESSDDDYAVQGFGELRHKASANPNRNSMPVTAFDLRNQSGYSKSNSLHDPVNTSSFLFDDENDLNHVPVKVVQQAATSPDSKTFLQLHETDDKFPILLRRETDGNMQFQPLQTEAASPEAHSRTDRATATRHRQSLPPTAIRQSVFGEGFTGLNGILSDTATAQNTAANRRSVEVKFSGLAEAKRPSLLTTPPKGGLNGPIMPTSSYSTNDIPTLKSIATMSPERNSVAVQSPAEEMSSPILQTSHGGFPFMSANMPLQLQSIQQPSQEPNKGYQSTQSGLQPSATPFGPSPTMHVAEGNPALTMTGRPPTSSSTSHSSPYYGGYSMQALTSGFGNMAVGNGPMTMGNGPMSMGNGHHNQWQSQMSMYPSGHQGYSQYPQPAGPRYNENIQQGRGGQQRRSGNTGNAGNADETARFNAVPLEKLKGEIYSLCKDQHGCRFLQKKLEERKPEHVQLIFEETNPHVVELMTDPFGNYLCQKLLEYATDEQRTELIRSASPKMIRIALNQHGTRALQKMIEFISTPHQIELIIEALDGEVVALIQDLNGNHVIQKCLNHLESLDVQFIINAVCTHVITVGTHRHGCCVLQRCIDHASNMQKAQLVAAITQNGFTLVQDPFGNYVVQYIMDLGEPQFSEPLCQSFITHVAVLSRQKFSSNVIEKGLRCAGEETRRTLILEMCNRVDLERMVRDSFANYVVQTAMDYADPETKRVLMDQMRPIVPLVRHTPHGRRIATKLQDYEGRVSGTTSGQATPQPMPLGQFSYPSATNGPYARNSANTNNFGQYAAAAANGYPQDFVPSRQQRAPTNGSRQASAGYQGLSNGGRNNQRNGLGHY